MEAVNPDVAMQRCPYCGYLPMTGHHLRFIPARKAGLFRDGREAALEVRCLRCRAEWHKPPVKS